MKNNSTVGNDTQTEPVKGAPLPSEEEYHARIDADFEAEGRRIKRNKRIRWVTLFALIGGAVAWYYSSDKNQEKVQSVITEAVAVKEALKEGTDVKGMMESYDEALDEIAMHGDTVDAAAAALSGKGELNLEHPSKRVEIDLEKIKNGKGTDAVAETTESVEEAESATNTARQVSSRDTAESNKTPARQGF